jgi:hypothetical protein
MAHIYRCIGGLGCGFNRFASQYGRYKSSSKPDNIRVVCRSQRHTAWVLKFAGEPAVAGSLVLYSLVLSWHPSLVGSGICEVRMTALVAGRMRVLCLIYPVDCTKLYSLTRPRRPCAPLYIAIDIVF